MKTRSLILAASLHAGAIALACSVVSIQAGNTAPPVATHAEVSQAVSGPGEVEPEPTRFIQTVRDTTPQTDADPAQLNADDVMPKFAPKPEPIPPATLHPPAETPMPSPHHEARPVLMRPTPRPAPEPLRPTQPVAGSPVRVKEIVSRPAVWNAPRLVKWSAPKEVSRDFEGRILAVIALDATGIVTGVTLEKGTGQSKLDKLLRQSFFDGQYKPATRNGKPVASELRQPVDFE